MPLLGAHMSIEGGVHRAVERGARAACDTVQLFTGSSQQWKSRPLEDEEISRFRGLQKECGVSPAVAHASYLINMATPDPANRERARGGLLEEIDRCDLLGLPFLIIHPGAHMGSGEEAGLDAVASMMNGVFGERPGSRTTTLLETTAGMGTSLGHRFDQLRGILDRLEEPGRAGICVDTCHVFAAGYDISHRAGYRKVMEELDREVGLDRVKAFHLNDSKKGLGCRLDRHEHIGAGALGITAFWCLLNDGRFDRIPMFLETPKGRELVEDRTNLALLRAQIGSRKPVPGPTVEPGAGKPAPRRAKPVAGASRRSSAPRAGPGLARKTRR